MKGNTKLLQAILGAMLMVSCGGKEANHEDAPTVDVVEVHDISEVGVTTFTGRTKSASEVNLAFRVSGQVQRILVKEGDHVSRGQVVAEMDSRDYELQLAATKAEYEQVKADAERVMALYAEGNTTASNNDKARYGLRQMEQKLATHSNQLADTRLRSTIDGYVQRKLRESGETVSAGMPVLSIFGSKDMEVEIKISASDYVNISKFTGFYSKFDVTGDDRFPLEISRISQEANSSQLYTVRLRFADSADRHKITPGMTTMVYAEVDNSQLSGIVKVPSSAVINTDGDKTQVFVYDTQTGTVHLQPVDVVAANRDGTMQVEGGLKSGDRVVASGVHHVKEGQKVRLLPKPAPSNIGGLL